MAKLPIPFPTWGTYKGHSGIDFPKTAGTPFYASGPGKVLRLSYSPAGGHWIVIRYDVGVTVGYAHMNNHDGCPKPGTRVTEGTFLGYVGYDGNVYPPGRQGAHIHLEIIGVATQAAVWRWFDKTRAVTTGKPTGGGGTTTFEEDDMEPIYVYNRTPYDHVYAVHPITGKKRALPKAEWEGAKLKGAEAWEASKSQVDEIPNG